MDIRPDTLQHKILLNKANLTMKRPEMAAKFLRSFQWMSDHPPSGINENILAGFIEILHLYNILPIKEMMMVCKCEKIQEPLKKPVRSRNTWNLTKFFLMNEVIQVFLST